MVSTDDIESTGRYICHFEPTGDDLMYYDKKNASIHLNQGSRPEDTDGCSRKSNGRINIGLGVEKKSLEVRNAKLNKKDTLHTLIDQYVEWNPLIKSIKLDETDANGKGYWSVTVRRQFDSLVFPGYMGAGDSMAMANPISAGGMGPAMTAGAMVGKIAAEAIAAKDTSLEYLWKYNLRYNEVYGSKTAGLEVFRVYLQSLNNDLINYGMTKFLTEDGGRGDKLRQRTRDNDSQHVQQDSGGRVEHKRVQEPPLRCEEDEGDEWHLLQLSEQPREFDAWKKSVYDGMHEVKERFKPNPI